VACAVQVPDTENHVPAVMPEKEKQFNWQKPGAPKARGSSSKHHCDGKDQTMRELPGGGVEKNRGKRTTWQFRIRLKKGGGDRKSPLNVTRRKEIKGGQMLGGSNQPENKSAAWITKRARVSEG